MDIFTEKEMLIGFVDTDSGGVLIADMLWDMPSSTQKHLSLDLEQEKTRIPIKAVRTEDGRRRLIIEIDEAMSLFKPKETVEVTDLPPPAEKKDEEET